MYVIGHLHYLEITKQLPLHADVRTRLFNQLPDYSILDCFKFQKILFVKKMHCHISHYFHNYLSQGHQKYYRVVMCLMVGESSKLNKSTACWCQHMTIQVLDSGLNG